MENLIDFKLPDGSIYSGDTGQTEKHLLVDTILICI